MKKRILSVFLAALMLLSLSATAFAAHLDGGTGHVTFSSNGKSLTSDFSSAELNKKVGEMQPGDDITFKVIMTNSYSKKTSWYMSNQIIDSLEDADAKNGAYSYELTYTSSSGKTTPIYRSESLGGTGGNGLLDLNNRLKEDYVKGNDRYFYVDQLNSGASGLVTLKVTLDGESQGNAYQQTAAELIMNFAVEVEETNTYKTGDDTNLTPLYIAMVVSGLLFLYFALDAVTDRIYFKKGKSRG